MMPDRECAIDGKLFTPQRRTDLTCSMDCQIRLRRQRSRESIARRYQPRPARPDGVCQGCQASISTSKTGPIPIWCLTCRASRENIRAAKRSTVRRCYKCQEPVPDAARRPGKTVCEDCRVDPRHRSKEHEQHRRLRKYGITQEQYDAMLEAQGGRCAGCATDNPGAKGWCIDHCHKSGRVRVLLCNRCNTVFGLTDEDPAKLRALAELIERLNSSIEQDKDIV